MQVNLQYAQEHLSDLVSAVDNGQEVEIARPNKPSLMLVVSHTTSQTRRTGKRILGAGCGELRVPSLEEWQDMDKELEHAMLDAHIATTDEI
jgi:antitoxin (DNA-binding transcriptional repressor) of toxin-antitoxin stability system